MIRGVLLDSGHTLVRPLGGTWWPTLPFRKVASELGVDPDDPALPATHEAALAYLDEVHALETLEEEEAQFTQFYHLLFEALHIRGRDALAKRLAHETVYEQQLEMYEDSMEVVHELRDAGLAVGVVSDSWPSLDLRYRMLGVRQYFDPFVISAPVGACKPDPRIFQVALDGIGLPPEQVFFVDDWPPLVEGAIEMGMDGAVITREEDPERPPHPFDSADDLRGILKLIQAR